MSVLQSLKPSAKEYPLKTLCKKTLILKSLFCVWETTPPAQKKSLRREHFSVYFSLFSLCLSKQTVPFSFFNLKRKWNRPKVIFPDSHNLETVNWLKRGLPLSQGIAPCSPPSRGGAAASKGLEHAGLYPLRNKHSVTQIFVSKDHFP